jgi:hypothetical protein
MKERKFFTGEKAANLVLAAAGGICLLTFLYFLYYYAWTGQQHFANWTGALISYGGSALAAGLLFFAVRFPSQRKINIATSLCSISFALYFFELATNIWFGLPSVMSRQNRAALARTASSYGVNFDTRTKRQVVLDLRDRGVDAVLSVFPKILLQKQTDGTVTSAIKIHGREVLPLGGISNRVVVVCNEGGQFLTYTSDEHGFHNPRNLWDRTQTDIVALGDSYTQGWCVPTDKNFVSEIRKRYPATLTLGIEGDGPLLELATLREYAKTLKPKVVLWFYFEANDLTDLQTEARSPLLRHYLTDGFSQGLATCQREIDHALTGYVEARINQNAMSRALNEVSTFVGDGALSAGRISPVIKLSQLRGRLGLVLGENAVAQGGNTFSKERAEAMRPTMNLFRDILVEANKSVSDWGGKLYFVYLPARTTYTPVAEVNQERPQVLQSAVDAGIPIIDIHKTFMTRKDPLALFPFRWTDHYNEEGHRLVAEEVLRSISVD